MDFGTILKITRQKAFLSQESFAVELNVSAATVNRWENGKNKPNLSALKKIKEFCVKNELPFDELEEAWFKYSKEHVGNEKL